DVAFGVGEVGAAAAPYFFLRLFGDAGSRRAQFVDGGVDEFARFDVDGHGDASEVRADVAGRDAGVLREMLEREEREDGAAGAERCEAVRAGGRLAPAEAAVEGAHRRHVV